MQARVDPRSVSVRDLSEADIPFVLDYWFRSPQGFIESLGADPTKLLAEDQLADSLRQRVRMNQTLADSKLSSLAIVHDGQFVGFHNLNPLTEGDFGIFHAHISRPEYRRRGVAECSYPQACRVFLQRFELRRILFKTPVQNVGAIRVKEKLGIRCIGEETVDFGIIRPGTLVKVFELTREEAGVPRPWSKP
jgi:RimJ/RimL family protein N-acetyltransferase